jgi:pimeloyl-ACP methyl ester carboxylesterase
VTDRLLLGELTDSQPESIHTSDQQFLSMEADAPLLTAPGLFSGNTHYILSPLIEREKENPSSPPFQELVVCIHGIGSYHGHFKHLVPRLTDAGYRVLTYDLIGRGYSKMPSAMVREDGTSIFDGPGHVSQLRDLLLDLQLTGRPYHLIAHSMGGAIASLYAVAYPDDIASISLLAPAGLMDLGLVKFLRRCRCLHGLIRSALQSNQEAAWRDDFQDPTKAVAEAALSDMRHMFSISPQHFEGFWLSVLAFPLFDLDSTIASLGTLHRLPIFLSWALHDRAVPMHPSLDRWKRILTTASHPSIREKIYEDGAHGFFIEFHETVNEDLLQFLGNNQIA